MSAAQWLMLALYLLGVADFLYLASGFGMRVSCPWVIARAFGWPALTAWNVADEIVGWITARSR